MNNFKKTKKKGDPPKKRKEAQQLNQLININFNNFSSNIQIINNVPNNERISINKPKLDDFQLNELEYKKAVKFDKRTFFQIYWSIIKREHILIFLFYFYDYNLYYIKLLDAFSLFALIWY